MKFALADTKEYLTLADFGQLSALAYESQKTIDAALHTYFPDWRIEDRHFTASPVAGQEFKRTESGALDWTTFYQFTESSNTTTVFAVRGTQYPIDVLQDVDLWLPAVKIYMFGKVGPSLAEWYVDAVAHLTSTGHRDTEKQAFGLLLDRVRAQMRLHPERQYFITGHSLGGGVAKLVAAQIAHLEPDRSLPAIVFAAPGLSATSYVVYGERRTPSLARGAVTVMPENDIVSRVDTQQDAIVHVACDGSVLACHGIYDTLCSIYDTCGSMRPGQNMSLSSKCPLLKK